MRNCLGLLAIVFLGACGESEPKVVKPPYDPIKTKILYKSMCGICHGEDGKMAISGAKDLSQSMLSLEERILMITDGKGNMTPFKDRLEESQITDLAHYIETLRE